MLRRLIKRFIYSQLMLREALLIMLGRSRPLVLFNVEADPPSIYFNFRIRADKLDALRSRMALPEQPTPCSIRCLDGEEPFPLLTLNIYRVSGLVNGMRAEWSVYVPDVDGVPRYLVLEPQADAFSMDPVGVFTKAGTVEHVLSGSRLRSRVVSDGRSFEAEVQMPPMDERRQVRAASEWLEANDYIFWRNGICDRTFYDGSLAVTPLSLLPNEGVQVRDDTLWGDFLEPEPVHVVALTRRVNFAISPWWNL